MNYNINSLYLHQASKVVIDFFNSKEDLKKFRIPSNISIVGNTVSSSIPMLLLHDMENLNKSKSKYFFLCGFGVGLRCSGLVLKINK
jgi:3-oxoacyl-[acyl-carrier-protein] synthase III